MDLDLKNKVAIVTGANGGIGFEICKAFLQERSQVVAFVRGGAERMAALYDWMKEIDIPKERLATLDVDIGDSLAMEKAVAAVVEKYHGIDVLVNNAGFAIEIPFLATEDEEWDNVLTTNLNVTSRLTRRVVKQMVKQKKGSVVNISSAVGQCAGRGVSAYASAKAAINRLTEILAIEVGRKGVRINAVAPGAIETKMSQPLKIRAGDIVLARTPLNRFGNPEEVAKAVLFLASENTASYITGHILNVDGGVSL